MTFLGAIAIIIGFISQFEPLSFSYFGINKKKGLYFLFIGLFLIVIGVASSTSTSTTLTIDQIREQALEIPYDDLARYPENYKGKPVIYAGEIIQKVSDTEFRINIANGETVYGHLVENAKEVRMIEGDRIEFIGLAQGEISYRTILGKNLTIPLIDIYDITIIPEHAEIDAFNNITELEIVKSIDNYMEVTLHRIGLMDTKRDGTYIRVDLTIENIGLEKFYFNPGNSVILGKSNNQFEQKLLFDSSFYNFSQILAHGDIYPGVRKNGAIFYEITDNTSLDIKELVIETGLRYTALKTRGIGQGDALVYHEELVFIFDLSDIDLTTNKLPKEQKIIEDVVEGIEAKVSVKPNSYLFVRKSPGTSEKTQSDILEQLENNQIVQVISKHGNSIEKDGYIWWEIYNPSSQIMGWVAAEFLLIEGGEIAKIERNNANIIATDYFPLQKGYYWKYTDAIDSIYEYHIKNEPVIKSGFEVILRHFVFSVTENSKLQEINSGAEMYTLDGKGDLYYFAVKNAMGENIFDKPKLIIKNNVSLGQSWEYISEGEETKRTITGFKKITTLAGSFEDCLEVEEVISIPGQIYNLKHYYAKDVGLVKSIADGEMVLKELVSFSQH